MPHPHEQETLKQIKTQLRETDSTGSNVCSAVLPVLLGQRRASSSKRMSLSTLIERAWILKMWVRPCNGGFKDG